MTKKIVGSLLLVAFAVSLAAPVMAAVSSRAAVGCGDPEPAPAPRPQPEPPQAP